MLQSSTLKFLKDLKKNNNKPWFDANREKYEDVKKDFGSFIQTVIDRHSKKDGNILELKAKDCLFRINRDIRFSKDKTPYKNGMGASIGKGAGNQAVLDIIFTLSRVIVSWQVENIILPLTSCVL